jgi:hypothetical protein
MEISAPKGERTEVVHLVATTTADTPRFNARTISGEAAAGTVEIVQRRFLVSSVEHYELQAQNEVYKPSFCLSSRIHVVVPEDDTTLFLETTRIQTRTVLQVVLTLAGIGLAIASIPYLMPYVMQFIDAL